VSDPSHRQRLRLLINPLRAPRGVDPDSTFPHSDTCFMNLKLPHYSSFAVMKEKLSIAIASDSGFGSVEEEAQIHALQTGQF
jgi:hypothetical protein